MTRPWVEPTIRIRAYHRRAIWFLASLLIFAGVSFSFFILPFYRQRVVDRSRELKTAETFLQEQKMYISKISEIENVYRKYHASYSKKVETAIPRSKNIPLLYAQLDDMARNHSLTLDSLSAREETSQKAPLVLSLVLITFSGGNYSDWKLFFQDIETHDRLLSVRQVSYDPLGNKTQAEIAFYSFGE